MKKDTVLPLLQLVLIVLGGFFLAAVITQADTILGQFIDIDLAQFTQ